MAMAYKTECNAISLTSPQSHWPPNRMMITKKNKYKLAKQILQVHYFCPDATGGVVLVGLKTLGKDAIYHYDQHSKLLFEHTFDGLVDSCAILHPKEAMVLQVKHNKIFILNLQKHQFRHYKFHYFQIEVSSQVTLQTFLDTSLVCIRQNGAVNDSRLKLTYYRYPFAQGNVKDPNQLVSTFQSTQDYEWSHEYSLRKGNNHSMLLWHKSRQDEIFELRIFDLRGKDLKSGRVQGNYRALRIKNTQQLQGRQIRVSISLMNVWQMRPNVFMLICTTDKQSRNLRNKNGNVISNFVWDVDNQTLKDTLIEFDPKYNQFQVETMSTGKYAMFRTFFFDSNGPQNSPAVFMQNINEKVVGQEWQKVSYLSKWMVPGYDDGLFAEGLYQNNSVSEMEVRLVKICNRHMQSFHMLMEGGEELDEELLAETIASLDYE